MAFAFEKLVAYQKSGDFADEICTRTELTPTVTIGEVFTRFLAWTEKNREPEPADGIAISCIAACGSQT